MGRLEAFISFFGPLLILMATSVLTLNSIAPSSLYPQLTFFAVGLVIIYLLSRVDYQLYLFSPWPWYALAVALLVFTLFLGDPVRGSTRWLDLGPVRLQTSELAKPFLILFLASFLTQKLPRNLKQLLVFLLLISIPVLLVFIQPDLGTALIIIFMGLTAMVASGIGFKHIGVLILTGILLAPAGYAQLKPYQQQRIISFINPSLDPLGTGYNSKQATIAVGSGQIMGRGLGQGTQSHLRFLPERHTDFIYASLTEELGLVGGGLILFAYLWLSRTMIQFARSSNSDTGSIIVLLTMAVIMFQVMVNIGMNMGLFPITGITLPMVSAGGSSILSLAVMLGIVYAVGTRPAHRDAKLEIH